MKDNISPLKTDYGSKYDDTLRTELLRLITEVPQRVFEIGCGSGATGLFFKQKFQGLEFVGLEPEEKAAQIAQTRLDRVIVSDIEKVELDTLGLKKGYFDIIICADVLEHLYDPWKTLFTLRDYLKANGKVIASIPNVQNIEVVAGLLNGNWTYEKSGILDATHIRFFTLSEIVKMFSAAGYKVIKCSRGIKPELECIKEWPTDITMGKAVLKDVTREEAVNFFTIQYFIIAQKVVSE